MKLIMDTDRVSIAACKAIEELADRNHIANNEIKSNCLTPYFKELIDTLLANSVRTNTKEGGEIQRVSYMTMCVLVQSTASDSYDLVFEFLMNSLQKLE